jgi:hypothetical protein
MPDPIVIRLAADTSADVLTLSELRRKSARVVLSPSPRSVAFYRRAGFGPAETLLLRTRPRPASPAGAGGGGPTRRCRGVR